MGGVTGVVAVNAPAHGHLAVPVRTGKVQAKADFVDPRGEDVFKQAVKGVVAFVAPQGS